MLLAVPMERHETRITHCHASVLQVAFRIAGAGTVSIGTSNVLAGVLQKLVKASYRHRVTILGSGITRLQS